VKRFLGALLAITATFSAFGQSKFGKIYVTWGYHRDSYTKSDIHFKDHKTDDYDFTLENARAKDRLDMKDFFHTPPTVPQYVLNVGYFFAKKPSWGIEVSWDHLKYIVIDNQVMHMKGTFRGKSYDLDTLVTPQFVHFEHTNGNNYLMVSAVRKFSLLPQGHFRNHLSVLVKAGAGGLVPKTDSSIMGNHNDGPFRLSGFVIGASTDLRYELFHYFYLEGGLKGAFADYTNAKVYEQGRAKHTFFSLQYIWALGVNIPLG
jgi:hypothetical protein